uniref:Uncharacterized protein n=1 Tax=Podarcis muralis TaxID=64176 RepID=A0A670JP19_PODMU
MKGSGKALMRHSSLAALPSISITSVRFFSTRGGPFSFISLRDLVVERRGSKANESGEQEWWEFWVLPRLSLFCTQELTACQKIQIVQLMWI